ncbi:MAG: hypothetical protein FK730_04555 [Asgard group archaeon]|nr:hypothetical protein [Asgard group archaeon]
MRSEKKLLKENLDMILVDLPKEDKESFEMVYEDYKSWVSSSRAYRIIQSLLGIFSILGTILIATTLNYIPFDYLFWIAIVTAVITFLFTGFSISIKSNGVMNARRIIQAALMRFYSGKIKIDKLIEAYFYAGALIGEVNLEVKSN